MKSNGFSMYPINRWTDFLEIRYRKLPSKVSTQFRFSVYMDLLCLVHIIVPKTDKITGGWTKLQNELHWQYFSPNIRHQNDQVKEDEMNRAERLERHHKEHLDAGGSIILKWILDNMLR
jgi:hypothetical protein